MLEISVRTRRDIDILAVVEDGALRSAAPLPPELREAVRDVGRNLGLAEDWLNPGPTSLLDLGLPAGFMERARRLVFGSLTVDFAGRFDQICFKLYAATDQGPRSKHVQDLRQLDPTLDELRAAAKWTRSHDPSPGFLRELQRTLAAFGSELDDDQL